ncbi:MAG: hypothetical protein EZS28_014307 [Streblomastix strix]|uniref:Protein RER1 n=1 Tax=Streblomastix strix TaxID=222440 RepID=A0A5J4W628_9EUKA|nr:MAG: hypothetical protein EZS28_014307 [Streblomastix strix]
MEGRPITARSKYSPKKIVDYLANKVVFRWMVFFVLAVIFEVRAVFIRSGYFIVIYFFLIFEIALTVRFLTPENIEILKDPQEELTLPGIGDVQRDQQRGEILDSGEYRPFMRKLPEFGYWSKSMLACVIANVLVSFDRLRFKMPVWFLVLYLIGFAVFALERPIRQLLKDGRSPFNPDNKKKKWNQSSSEEL